MLIAYLYSVCLCGVCVSVGVYLYVQQQQLYYSLQIIIIVIDQCFAWVQSQEILVLLEIINLQPLLHKT